MKKNIFVLIGVFFLSASAFAKSYNVSDLVAPELQILHKDETGKVLKSSKGYVVLPLQKEYFLEVISPGEINIFMLMTEAGVSESKPKLKKFKNRYRFKFSFKSPVEKGKPFKIFTYEASKNKRDAWAYLVFRDTEVFNLGATLYCNRKPKENPVGAAVCGSYEGFTLLLAFSQNVDFKTASPEPACHNNAPEKMKDRRVFKMQMPLGECRYLFFTGGKSNFFTLYTHGYKKVKIPEEDLRKGGRKGFFRRLIGL